MRTTNVGDLSSAIAAEIRGLTPSSTTRQDDRWREVDDIAQVPGGEIRTFYVDVVDATPVFDGIYSPSSFECQATVLVYTSYLNTRRAEQRALAFSDWQQIYLTIDVLRDANPSTTIAGLVSFEHNGWNDEDDEAGRQWGAHIFTVRFLATGIPGAT